MPSPTLPSSFTTEAARKLIRSCPATEWAAIDSWASTFFAFQREWLFDGSRFSLLNKARQIGASHTAGAMAALWAMLGETTTIISLGDREAREVVEKAGRHLETLITLGSEWAQCKPRQGNIETRFGGRIVALPSTSAGRGMSGNVILDEFAYHSDPKAVWDGAAAVAMHGYKLRIMSTPNGVGNLWYQFWTDPNKNRGFRKHEVTIHQARADGMVVTEETCNTLSHGDPRLYDQLFRCKFIDGEAQYIPTAAIEACSVDEPYCLDGDCYAGLDIGRTNDLTALVIVRKTPELTATRDGELFVIQPSEFWQVHTETRKRTETEDLFALAETALGPPFYARRLCVDATGLGAFPADDLRKHYGLRVEPVPFTSASKEDMATTLYSAFTQHRLRIDRADTALREDVCSLRRIITSAGNVRYDAPVTDKGHGDRAWALALALHGCTGPGNGKFEIAPMGD